MAISHLLTKLSNEMNSTVVALDLPEGTNYTDIAHMASNGEITTEGGGKQFREIEFENYYCDEGFEELSENDEASLLALLEHYESGESDLILIRYIENAAGCSPDIASIRVNDFNGTKGAFIYTLSGSYSIDYTPGGTHIQPMWGNVTWNDAEHELQTQYSWIPEPSEDWVGRIIQYTDNIEPGFVKGNFYECVGDWSGDDPVFTWEHIDFGGSDTGSFKILGNYTDFDTSQKAINLNELEVGTVYAIGYLAPAGVEKKVYYSITTTISGTEQTFTSYWGGTDFPPISGFLYFYKSADIPETTTAKTKIGTVWYESIWVGRGGAVQRSYGDTYINTTGIESSGMAGTLGYLLSDDSQSIYGVKTFSSFPVTPSNAPTTNYQVANKKYVDDAASHFLATDNTTSFTPVGDYNPSTKKYVDDTVYGVNSYMTTGDPKLIGFYNGRNIWRKTFEYTQSAIQNWTAQAQGNDFATYLVQLPTDYDNVEFVINSHADADVYLSDPGMSVDISNTFDPLEPIMSCQLLQFIKTGPDSHQYFRLLLGDNVKDHATKISITIEWIEAQIVVA